MGVVTLIALLLSSLASGIIVMWSGRPGTRADFQRSGGGVGGTLQGVSCLAWGAVVWLLLAGLEHGVWLKWCALALGIAVAALLIAWGIHVARVGRWKQRSPLGQVKVA